MYFISELVTSKLTKNWKIVTALTLYIVVARLASVYVYMSMDLTPKRCIYTLPHYLYIDSYMILFVNYTQLPRISYLDHQYIL
jgi:hypothetical protein